MNYCDRCILPDTRPGLTIGSDGICSACRAHETARTEVDWDARSRRFDQLAERVKERQAPYDCLIPVSGGKDSHWQVITCLERDLHPLSVTWRTPGRTALGERNLANLVGLGVDHVEVQVNPRVERKFMLKALIEKGSTAVPMHMAIFAIPLTVAARLGIPLLVWGENSAREYAGETGELDSQRLDSAWVEKYGVVHGTTAADWVSGELSAEELTPYFAPPDEQLERQGIEGVFLGDFFRWDPAEVAAVARGHGFEAEREGSARTGVYEYADVDDEFISIHHWIKWLKFGFTRSYDNLSLEIRNGRITREQAIDEIRRIGDETPHSDIAGLCEFLGIGTERFFAIVESHRNSEIWTKRDGVWRIEGFLIDDWDWQ